MNGKKINPMSSLQSDATDYHGIGKLQGIDSNGHISDKNFGYDDPENEVNEHPDAEFAGWQITPYGRIFALYNVVAKNHPLYHSTVSDRTLFKQHLRVPEMSNRHYADKK